MATYLDLEKCQLLCSCNRTSPLCSLYFCRHCLDLRCTQCVTHEVDSHFCPYCLENMASAEAKMRKHRCGSCFDCPCCGTSLSFRATVVVQAKTEEPGRVSTQKAFFLCCGVCRWSTRDSGIPDQPQSSGCWQDRVSPDFKRISELINSYHLLAVREKADQEWSKFVRKRNYMLLLERYPVLNPRLKRYSTTSWNTASRETESTKNFVIPSATASSELPEFNLDSFINQPLCIDKITKISGRFLAPQTQPVQAEKLLPLPKHLLVKRSLRCRVCEHNLSRPDFNPAETKFRINLSAIYHVPEIRFIIPTAKKEDEETHLTNKNERRTSTNLSELRAKPVVYSKSLSGQSTEIILVISNPAHRITTVSIKQLTPEEEQTHLCDMKSDLDELKPQLQSVVDESGDTNVAPIFSTVKLTLPDTELKLAPRDDIIDYDETVSGDALGDVKHDPNLFAFRRGNKLGIRAKITPLIRTQSTNRLSTVSEDSEMNKDSSNLVPLRAAIFVGFDYKNTTLVAESKSSAISKTTANAENKEKSETSTSDERKKSVNLVEKSNEIKQIRLLVLLNFGNICV